MPTGQQDWKAINVSQNDPNSTEASPATEEMCAGEKRMACLLSRPVPTVDIGNRSTGWELGKRICSQRRDVKAHR